MRPRWNFILKIVLVAFLIFIIFLISVFICNFILFHISESGRGALLGFGPRGYYSFLEFFPWGLLALDGVLLLVLHYLLKKFEFGYKRPGAYVIISVFVIILTSGMIVSSQTPLNKELSRQATMGHLPAPFRQLYDRTHRPLPPGHGLCRCEVLYISNGALTLRDTGEKREIFTLILPAEFPHEEFEEGDIVLVAGEIKDGVIHAFGIRKINRE